MREGQTIPNSGVVVRADVSLGALRSIPVKAFFFLPMAFPLISMLKCCLYGSTAILSSLVDLVGPTQNQTLGEEKTML